MRFRGAAAPGQRGAADGPFGFPRLALGAAALRGELLVDQPAASLTKVPGPITTFTRAQPRKLPAGTLGPPSRGEPGGGDLARDASLQAQQAVDVGAEQELLADCP